MIRTTSQHSSRSHRSVHLNELRSQASCKHALGNTPLGARATRTLSACSLRPNMRASIPYAAAAWATRKNTHNLVVAKELSCRVAIHGATVHEVSTAHTPTGVGHCHELTAAGRGGGYVGRLECSM